MDRIPAGKLPAKLLERLLSRYVAVEERVVVGPGVGRDAALLDMGDRLLVATADPVTYATDQISWYAVHVNANDVACSGATPRWFLATVLLPEDEANGLLAESIFQQLAEACRELDVALCGGHTEIVAGLPRAIIAGQMLGEARRDAYVTSAGAQVGDAVILTKGFAIEGTALLARQQRQELAGVLSNEELHHAAELLHSPGISVVRDARLAMAAGGVHALHDPTEGGLATGLRELAQASQVGLVIQQAALPLLPECDTICRHFGLDPLGLIASGSLLVSARRDRAAAIVQRLAAEGIPAAEIGQVVPQEEGCRLRAADGSLAPLPSFDRDEIVRVL